MTLAEEAKILIKNKKKEAAALKAKKEEEEELAAIEHAHNLLFDMKSEVRTKVLEEANLGKKSTSITIFGWGTRTEEPLWFTFFRDPFEEYLTAEGLSYIFDTSTTDNYISGWYELKW